MVHWADYMVERIIKEHGDKKEYVVESGITPSGYVHIGNFRELFTAYIVGHALRDRGKKVRHIHMWTTMIDLGKYQRTFQRSGLNT